MTFGWPEFISWILVGLLVGVFTANLVTRRKEGYGFWKNLGLGMAGALLGSMIFRFLGVGFGLERVSISLEDLVSGFLGALLVLAGLYFYRRGKE